MAFVKVTGTNKIQMVINTDKIYRIDILESYYNVYLDNDRKEQRSLAQLSVEEGQKLENFLKTASL
jgi:hypothetical protein